MPQYSFDMLRFVRHSEDSPWCPAAGTFPGWPTDAKALTILDPCCGSGHFLTEALAILTAMRQAGEGLSAASAVKSVLRHNLHGLEIDGRCVQIAAFAVALTAWRLGEWQSLPLPHVAWVGAPPPLAKREFVALSDGDSELGYALGSLYDLFMKAPVLGSLIESSGRDLFEAEKMREIERSMNDILEKTSRIQPDRTEGMIAARGMMDAAHILMQRHWIICTNVPFLGQRNQSKELFSFIESRYPYSKNDLGIVFVERLLRMVCTFGTVALVSPQSWQFGWSYRELRRNLLREWSIKSIATLGARAFETISGEVVNVSLSIIESQIPQDNSLYFGIDANDERDAKEKARKLLCSHGFILLQSKQLKNPDYRIYARFHEIENGRLISEFATTFQGIKSGDDFRWVRNFWEIESIDNNWKTMQTTVTIDTLYGGCNLIIFWGRDGKHLTRRREEGQAAAQKYKSVAISQMGNLSCAILHGQTFDSNISPIFFIDDDVSAPLFSFFRSEEYKEKVHSLEPGRKVNNTTFLKVAFDEERWKEQAMLDFPDGLPEPYSREPAQWLFHGHPADSARGTAVHVVLARVMGYRWPGEMDGELHLSDEARGWIAKATGLPVGDNDGLVGVSGCSK